MPVAKQISKVTKEVTRLTKFGTIEGGNYMMMAKHAVVFSGRNGLDLIEFRTGVLRIPEVTLRLRQAQEMMSKAGAVGIDLLSALSSDDEFFFRNIQLKSLLAAIVQVGLYDRYLKTQKAAQMRSHFLIGNSNGDSAMMVCAGKLSFQDMVLQSPVVAAVGVDEAAVAPAVLSMVGQTAPMLTGVSIVEYQALEAKSVDGGIEYSTAIRGEVEVKKLINSLYQNHGVASFIHVGPASVMRGSDYREIGDGQIEFIDCIELDPLLTWFWQGMRPQALALAL
jgi:hypothetical protein